jgi:hypothetical protein
VAHILYVYYEIKHWDSTKSQFSKEIRTEDSRNGSPLIAHGKDGVEMAILLDDLHLTKGSKFLITYNEFLVPSVCVNWSLIEIK